MFQLSQRQAAETKVGISHTVFGGIIEVGSLDSSFPRATSDESTVQWICVSDITRAASDCVNGLRGLRQGLICTFIKLFLLLCSVSAYAKTSREIAALRRTDAQFVCECLLLGLYKRNASNA